MRKLFDINTWREVFETLKKNKKRTLTTMSGVFWGLLLLTLLLSFGEGFINGQKLVFNALGDNGNINVVVPETTSTPYLGYAKDRTIYLTEKDCQALLANFPSITSIETMVTNWQGYTLYANGVKASASMLCGVSPNYFYTMKVNVVEGRLLNPKDEAQKTHNCLLGLNLAKRLFPEESPIGKTIQLLNTSYAVVGVIEPVSDNFSISGDLRSQIIIPQSLMTSLYVPEGNFQALIIVFKNDLKKPSELSQSLLSFLQKRHDIAPNDQSAIRVFDTSQMVRISNAMILGISILVWVVGMGTLLAGIIGITNILLVSISERTKEIGIRKALGARNKDIRFQILLESFTITFIAGILGTALGVGIMLVINSLMKKGSNAILYHPLIPTSVAFITILIIAISGLLAGILPLSRALKIDTIKALQDE